MTPPAALAPLRCHQPVLVPCWGCGWPLLHDEETDLCWWCAPDYVLATPDPTAPDLLRGVPTEQLADMADGILTWHLDQVATNAQTIGDPDYLAQALELAEQRLTAVLDHDRHLIEQERPVRAHQRHQRLIRVAQGVRA